MTAPGPARAFLGSQLRQLRHGALDEGGEIHRQPPGRALLGAARRHHRPDQRRQHRSGVLPPDQIEAFEGLVDEVQHVAAVGVDPLGAGHEQQLGQHRRRGTTGDRGEQRALGTVAMAHGRPAPQPALQGRRVGGAGERGAVAAWCLAGAVASDAPRAVEQGEAGRLLRQLGHQISQSREDGQADTPPVAILRCRTAQPGAVPTTPAGLAPTGHAPPWRRPDPDRGPSRPRAGGASDPPGRHGRTRAVPRHLPRGPRPDRLARRPPTGRTCSRWPDRTARDANDRSGCRPRPSRDRAGSPCAGSDCRARGDAPARRPRAPAGGVPAAPSGPWPAAPQVCPREGTRGPCQS